MRRHRYTLRLFLIILIGFLVYSVWVIYRPLNKLSPNIDSSLNKNYKTLSNINWPATGQSAVGLLNTPIIETHNTQTPVPTASTAKMITAIMVLKAKPLNFGEAGTDITLTDNDVNIFKSYAAKQGSVFAIQSGEKLNEHQMLEAMLLPSANNIADSLAIWAYGSLTNYIKAANDYLVIQNLRQTKIGSDASGLSPDSVSTASDLVKIGELFMQNSVLADIVSKVIVNDIPGSTQVKNVNYLLGSNNVVGIKTGNNDQDGGVFVGAAKIILNGHSVVIISANAGVQTLGQAVSGSLPLLKSAQNNFQKIHVIRKDQQIASYYVDWRKDKVAAVSSSDISVTVWGGSSFILSLPSLPNLSVPQKANNLLGVTKVIGPGIVSSDNSNVVLQKDINKPSVFWKLSHP